MAWANFRVADYPGVVLSLNFSVSKAGGRCQRGDLLIREIAGGTLLVSAPASGREHMIIRKAITILNLTAAVALAAAGQGPNRATMLAHLKQVTTWSQLSRRTVPPTEFEIHFRSAALDKSGPRLPFGCKIPKLVPAGCGGTREAEEGEDETKRVAVACGLGRAPRESRRFLSFLKE